MSPRSRLLPRFLRHFWGTAGIGIEAKKAAIQHLAEAKGGDLISEHVEVGTGKGADALAPS